MPVDGQQLPEDASLLRQMVLDLVAQLDAEQARRLKTEPLLRQLPAARCGRKSEQLTTDQLALFAAELKAQGVNLETATESGRDQDSSDDGPSGNAAMDQQSTASPMAGGRFRRT